MKKLKSFLFFFIRISITFTILFFLFKKSDFNKLKEIFKNVSFIYYIFALLCVYSFQALIALRWKSICETWKVKNKYFFYLKSYLMGFSLSTVIPGIVGNDFLRSYMLVKNGLDWKRASLSVIFDRIFGLLGILFILSFSLPIFGKFLPFKFYFFLLSLIYGVITVGILANFIFFKLKKNFPEHLKPLFIPHMIKPLFLGFVVQLLFVLQFYFLSKSLHLNIKFFNLLVIIPGVSFLSALPLSISGLGVREGSLSYFLSLFHYSIEYGISLGLLGYSLILLSALPGLCFYLKERILWK